MTSDNRRAFYRVSLNQLEARVTAISGGRASRFVVSIVNLGGGGSLVYSTHHLKADDRLRLHLPGIDGYEPLNLSGKVLRTEPFRRGWLLGIQFTDLNDATRDLIVRRVNHEELRHGVPIAAPGPHRSV